MSDQEIVDCSVIFVGYPERMGVNAVKRMLTQAKAKVPAIVDGKLHPALEPYKEEFIERYGRPISDKDTIVIASNRKQG